MYDFPHEYDAGSNHHSDAAEDFPDFPLDPDPWSGPTPDTVPGTVIRSTTEGRPEQSRPLPAGLADASPTALRWLAERGIPVAWSVEEFNTRYIVDKADYPQILSGYAGGADGTSGALRFDYQPIAGEGWSQIRLDNPPTGEDRSDGRPGKPKEYLGNSGGSTGERFMLNKTMSARLAGGEYSRVLIVEGTGQYQVASYVYATDRSTLVVGVPGCWGWSSEGLAASEVYTFCEGIKQVYVAFDADLDDFNGRRGNPKVHAAGQRLEETIIAAAGERPRFLHLPSHGDKDGFDDYIAGSFRINDEHGDSIIDAARARAAVDRLLGSAKMTTLLKKAPPKPLSPEVALVGDRSPIRWIDHPDGPHMIGLRNDGRTAKVAHNFALRIVGSANIEDRLNGAEQGLAYDVEIACGNDVRRVEDIRQSDLYNIDDLAARAGFAYAAWEKSPANAGMIVAAIKEDAARRQVPTGQALRHTGFFVADDGTPGWATPSGIITATGLHREQGKALFERGTEGANIDFSILSTATEEQIRQAWLAERDVLEMFRDPTAHIAATGHQALAVTGFPSEGVLFLVAPPNSGKTQFTRWQAERWGKRYGLHNLPGQSTANGSDVGQGLDGALVVMDDFKPFENSPEDRKQALAVLDMLVRRGGAGVGEHAGRSVKRQSASGAWKQGATDKAHPAFITSGEEFPSELDTSSKQRILVIEYPTHNFQHADGTDRYRDWIDAGASGKPNLATASYLQYVCRAFEDGDADTIDEWRDQIHSEREWRTDALIEQIGLPKKLRRVGLVAAARLLGWEMWVGAGAYYGAWDEEEAHRLGAWGRRLIVEATRTHVERYLDPAPSSEDPAAALIAAIQEVDFNQTCIQRALDEKPGRHGWVGAYLPNGDVALAAHLTAKALGSAWPRGKVTDTLRALSGQQKSEWAHPFGKNMRAYVVPKAIWDGDSTSPANAAA